MREGWKESKGGKEGRSEEETPPCLAIRMYTMCDSLSQAFNDSFTYRKHPAEKWGVLNWRVLQQWNKLSIHHMVCPEYCCLCSYKIFHLYTYFITHIHLPFFSNHPLLSPVSPAKTKEATSLVDADSPGAFCLLHVYHLAEHNGQ